MSDKPRLYGIDILRIVSMFMIVVLHVLGSGGGLLAYNVRSVEGSFVWGIEAFCYCAVNVYAIITGYLSYGRSSFDKKYASTIIKRYIQVWFYSFAITIIIYILEPEIIGLENVAKSCFPIMFKQYWYYTAYFFVAVFGKYINDFIDGMDAKEIKVFIVLTVLFLSFFPTVRRGDVFGENGGYSALWISYMYFLGAIINKYKVIDRISRKRALLILILSWGIALLSKIAVSFISDKNSMFLISYVSPVIILEAVSLFVIFSKISFKPRNKKMLLAISSSTFGIYLIHSNISLTLAYFNGFFAHKSFIALALGSCSIFIFCLILELLRKQLFDILRIEEVTLKICTFCERRIESLGKK